MIGRLWLVVILIAACGAGVLFAAAFSESILAGDALNYRDRMVELFAGKLPYLEFRFEHLPVMIIPMAAAWILGGSQDVRSYAFALAAVSTLVVVATGLLLHRIEAGLRLAGVTVRWTLLTIPLLPFLLFRNDSWVVLLALAGILLAVSGRKLASALTLTLATMAKGWPGLWAAAEWKRGNRWVAATLAAGIALSLAVVLSPPLQEAQDSRGLHTETAGGAVAGLARSIGGLPLGLERSTAVYIDAPWPLLAVNALLGGLIVLRALPGLLAPFEWDRSWRLMGALTIALIVASPLFSTQYVAWVSPFAAVDREASAGMFSVNAMSLVLLTTWHEMFQGAIWWWGLLVVRNFLLIMVGLYLGRSSTEHGSGLGWQGASTAGVRGS